MILDVNKAEQQKRLLEVELEAIGMRLNRKKPDVLLKPKKAGGVSISHTVPMTKIDEKTIRTIVRNRKFFLVSLGNMRKANALSSTFSLFIFPPPTILPLSLPPLDLSFPRGRSL